MPEFPLDEFASVTLDGSGNGTPAPLGPAYPREVWIPTTITVGTSQNPLSVVNDASCVVYQGWGVNQAVALGSTLTGSTGDSMGLSGIELHAGKSIIAVWTTGDAGAVATIRVQGTRRVP